MPVAVSRAMHEERYQAVVVPACFHATPSNARLGRSVLLQQRQGQTPHHGHLLLCMSFAHPALVLTAGDIQAPVRVSLD